MTLDAQKVVPPSTPMVALRGVCVAGWSGLTPGCLPALTPSGLASPVLVASHPARLLHKAIAAMGGLPQVAATGWLGYVRVVSIADGPDGAAGASGVKTRYERLDRLAVGGMAEVWLGRDVATNERAALKVALDDPSGTTRQQLANEAAVLQSLPPDIAPALLQQDNHQLALELLDGVTLERLLVHYRKRGKRLPKSAVAQLLTGAGKALELLRSAAVVHSDITPANVFVTRDGEVRLLDFGTALTPESEPPPMTLRGTPAF